MTELYLQHQYDPERVCNMEELCFAVAYRRASVNQDLRWVVESLVDRGPRLLGFPNASASRVHH